MDSVYRTPQIHTLALLSGQRAPATAPAIPRVTHPEGCGCHTAMADSSLPWRLLPVTVMTQVYAPTVPNLTSCPPPFISSSRGLPDATEAGALSGLT